MANYTEQCRICEVEYESSSRSGCPRCDVPLSDKEIEALLENKAFWAFPATRIHARIHATLVEVPTLRAGAGCEHESALVKGALDAQADAEKQYYQARREVEALRAGIKGALGVEGYPSDADLVEAARRQTVVVSAVEQYRVTIGNQEDRITRLKRDLQRAEEDAHHGAVLCPCLIADTPCDPRCTCVMPHSSKGCGCCAKYGSREQRKGMAKFLVGRRNVHLRLRKFELRVRELVSGWESKLWSADEVAHSTNIALGVLDDEREGKAEETPE